MKNNNSPDLAIEEWERIAFELCEMGVFHCVISGGEPTLLGNKLFDIMDIFHKYGVTFILITNGMLINESNVMRFSKYKYNWFQVSIDGSRPELHDHIRGAVSFEKAVNAASLVKQAGMPLVIAHSVMKHNKDYLEEMIDLAYLLGAIKIIAGPFSYTGRAVLNSADIELSDDEITEIYRVADNKASQYSGLMEVAIPIEEIVSLRVNLFEPNGVLLIRPNGDVKFDCISPFKIGNVREKTLMDIWRDGRTVHAHPRLREYASQIKFHRDFLTVYPKVNVDPDEMLIFGDA